MSKSEESSEQKSSRSDKGQKHNRSEGQIKVERVSMALAGNIDPFIPGSDFESYEDRINQFFWQTT